ncbi:MAG TPA: alcohol dehydrogenase catalytic domain-containing protein [Negativicutes bacterium]|nr:alcohol dehydrogenase catalytic domain-containing protein [Negativicutes bacterium]
MKAIVKYADGPEGIGLKEIPIPEISEGDVLVKVKAAGLCGSDIHIYKSAKLPPFGKIGVVIGHEFAGEIVEVGSRVKHWKVSDRVASDNTGSVCGVCHACMIGEPIHCVHRLGLGSDLDGGFAEYVKIPADVLDVFPACLVHIPDSLSYEEAAILDPMANGYCAVVQHGTIMPGDSVAVVGVGPLGLACINAAKASGAAYVFAIVRKSTNVLHREIAKKLGATRVLEQETDDIAAEILSRTNGEGVESVFECAGPMSVVESCLPFTRSGGKIVRVGLVFEGDGLSLDAVNQMTFRNISLVGHNGYSPLVWANCLNLLSAGILDAKSTITHILPLEDYRKGVDLMLNREAVKVIFKP